MEEEDQENALSGNFEYLPDVPLLNIFSFLRNDELCQVGGVCTRWYALTRSKSVWKHVDVHHMQLKSSQIGKLFRILPKNTTSLRIRGFDTEDEVPPFQCLQERCPFLQTLILDSVTLVNRTLRKMMRFQDLTRSVTILSLRRCLLPTCFYVHPQDIKCGTEEPNTRIQVLDCTQSRCLLKVNLLLICRYLQLNLQELYLASYPVSNEDMFTIVSFISRLKVLDLEGTHVDGSIFTVLIDYCKSLEQLYLARTIVDDEDLRKITGFTELKIICLKGTRTSLIGQRYLISSLPKLRFLNGLERCEALRTETLGNAPDICVHFLLREKQLSMCEPENVKERI